MTIVTKQPGYKLDIDRSRSIKNIGLFRQFTQNKREISETMFITANSRLNNYTIIYLLLRRTCFCSLQADKPQGHCREKSVLPKCLDFHVVRVSQASAWLTWWITYTVIEIVRFQSFGIYKWRSSWTCYIAVMTCWPRTKHNGYILVTKLMTEK